MRGLLRRLRGVPELKTERLRLVAMTPAMLEADTAGDGGLCRLLRAEVSAEWPPADWETHVLAMIFEQCETVPESAGWHRYVVLLEGGERVLVGCVGGFLKPGGVVEIGYSTVPGFQRRGFGTEAAQALVEWLLRQKGVRAVTAQAFAQARESITVMERCGLVFAGAGDDPGTVRYRRER